jgi:hypothetical protein
MGVGRQDSREDAPFEREPSLERQVGRLNNLPATKKREFNFTEQVSARSVPGCSGLAWDILWGCFGFGFMPLLKNWVLGHVFSIFRFCLFRGKGPRNAGAKIIAELAAAQGRLRFSLAAGLMRI